MTRVLAPWLRIFRHRSPVPQRLRVIDGGKAAPVLTLVRARSFDELDPDPYSQAFGDVVSVPFEGKVR
jgi:hypothetical protein